MTSWVFLLLSSYFSFQVFLLSRVLHTFVYVSGIRQPFRAITFAIGMTSLASITLQTIAAAWQYL